MNTMCTTLTYFGSNGSCVLFSSRFLKENLQLVPYDMNSVAISLLDRVTSSKYTFLIIILLFLYKMFSALSKANDNHVNNK